MSSHSGPSLTDLVPLFPLPNVVLLPGATQPLQIFEPRYREMTRDALDDDGLIALALLKPDYAEEYYTNLAEIYPVVCVGQIREHVLLPDGRYFINLEGLMRARVREEDHTEEYRRAILEPIVREGTGIEEDGERTLRNELLKTLSHPPFEEQQSFDLARELLIGPASFDEVVDRVAFELLPHDAVEIRQRLLEELDAVRRGQTLLGELETVGRVLSARRLHDLHRLRDVANN